MSNSEDKIRKGNVDFVLYIDQAVCEEHKKEIPLQACMEEMALARASRKKQQLIEDSIIALLILLVIGFGIFIALRIRRRIGVGKFKTILFAVLSGWAIWCFTVVSFAYLTNSDVLDDAKLILGWVISPPILLFLIMWWKSKFVGR